jgi:hypothetical protein
MNGEVKLTFYYALKRKENSLKLEIIILKLINKTMFGIKRWISFK